MNWPLKHFDETRDMPIARWSFDQVEDRALSFQLRRGLATAGTADPVRVAPAELVASFSSELQVQV